MTDIIFVPCPKCKGTGGFMRFEVNALANFWSDWVLYKQEIFDNFKSGLKQHDYCSLCGGRTEIAKIIKKEKKNV